MAAAAPYILAVGAAVVKDQAAQQQAKEQRSQLNAALTRTNQTQDKASKMIQAESDQLSPTARMAAMSSQIDQNTAGSTSDLAKAGATDSQGNAIIDTAGDHGAVSGDFLTAKADRALAEGDRLSTIARQLAKVRAPGQLVEQEGQGRAALTEALGNLWGTTQNLNQANTDTAQGIQLPSYAALGDLASTAGAAYGSRAAPSKYGASKMLPKNAQGGTVWPGGDSTSGGFA